MHEAAAVTGVGETAYARGIAEHSSLALQLQTGLTAVRDAGLAPADIDGVVPMSKGSALTEDFIGAFCIQDMRFSAMVPMGGASPVAALQLDAAVIAAGICRHVLLPTRRDRRGGDASARVRQLAAFHTVAEFEMPLGAFAPVQLYAAMARRHMETFGQRAAAHPIVKPAESGIQIGQLLAASPDSANASRRFALGRTGRASPLRALVRPFNLGKPGADGRRARAPAAAPSPAAASAAAP